MQERKLVRSGDARRSIAGRNHACGFPWSIVARTGRGCRAGLRSTQLFNEFFVAVAIMTTIMWCREFSLPEVLNSYEIEVTRRRTEGFRHD